MEKDLEIMNMDYRQEILSEVINHLQRAAGLFLRLKHIDDKMVLREISTGVGNVIVTLKCSDGGNHD